MILKGEIFKTASARPKQRGRNDIFRLVPETREEAEELEKLARHGRLTSFTGSADRERTLNDLRNTARAVDPRFKEDFRTITA